MEVGKLLMMVVMVVVVVVTLQAGMTQPALLGSLFKPRAPLSPRPRNHHRYTNMHIHVQCTNSTQVYVAECDELERHSKQGYSEWLEVYLFALLP